MQVLHHASNDYSVLEHDPVIEIHHEVIYVPVTPDTYWDVHPSWGVYSADGKLIEAAGYFRGPGKTLIGQLPEITVTADLPYAEVDTAIYTGIHIEHFGHFLLSTLGRYWAVESFDYRATALLGHGGGDALGWFAQPHTSVLLGALGLTPDNYLRLTQPTRIRRLIIPRPSLEEHNFVHRAYKRVCGTVGDRLLRGEPRQSGDVAYLSKTRLTLGVQRFTNEAALESQLAAAGVEIVYPETMSLGAQAALFRDKRVLVGTAGSAFHASVLAPPNAHLIQLTPYNAINSNLRLTDEVNGNRCTYLQVPSEPDTDSSVLIAFRFPDPDAIAAEILTVVEQVLEREPPLPVLVEAAPAPAPESDTAPPHQRRPALERLTALFLRR